MRKWIASSIRVPGRYYAWGCAAILAVVVHVMATQVADRQGFANGKLREDVVERWGAPIVQSAPSLRYVESGSVFTTMGRLPMDHQHIRLDARMSYRKRGLVYFSGFEFGFEGEYGITNPRDFAIDAVFVLPVHQARRSMLRDLRFSVNGEPTELPMDGDGQTLVWTGRLLPGESASFLVAFEGRGLEFFQYALDPDLPVRDFSLDIDIHGGANFDYAQGVVPASSIEQRDDGVSLEWSFASLEAGFPFGVILPSEESFDAMVLTMIRRAWPTFGLFLIALAILGTYYDRPLSRLEAYLASAGWAVFYVLLPYLAAYVHFYAAYAVATAGVSGLLWLYLGRIWPRGRFPIAGAIVGLLVLPTLAVVTDRHTGLVYTLEIVAGLGLLMALSLRPAIRELAGRFEASLVQRSEEV